MLRWLSLNADVVTLVNEVLPAVRGERPVGAERCDASSS
jgi:hypothetical protein